MGAEEQGGGWWLSGRETRRTVDGLFSGGYDEVVWLKGMSHGAFPERVSFVALFGQVEFAVTW